MNVPCNEYYLLYVNCEEKQKQHSTKCIMQKQPVRFVHILQRSAKVGAQGCVKAADKLGKKVIS